MNKTIPNIRNYFQFNLGSLFFATMAIILVSTVLTTRGPVLLDINKSLYEHIVQKRVDGIMNIAAKEDIAQMIRLFNAGLNINKKDSQGRTLTYLAVQNENHLLLKFLIDNGALIDIKNHAGISPLLIASQANDQRSIDLLLKASSNTNTTNKFSSTPLHFAAAKGYSDLAMRLIAEGASIDPQNMMGLTPLLLAAKNGHIKVFNSLIENGADSRTTDLSGATAKKYLSDFLAKNKERLTSNELNLFEESIKRLN